MLNKLHISQHIFKGSRSNHPIPSKIRACHFKICDYQVFVNLGVNQTVSTGPRFHFEIQHQKYSFLETWHRSWPVWHKNGLFSLWKIQQNLTGPYPEETSKALFTSTNKLMGTSSPNLLQLCSIFILTSAFTIDIREAYVTSSTHVILQREADMLYVQLQVLCVWLI